MLITKLATIHGDRLRVRVQVPTSVGPVPEPSALIYVWSDYFRERVPCPIQTGLHRAQIAVGDFSDLLIRLAFQLPEDKHISVMLGKLGHALLDDFPEMTLPVHVIRT